MRSNIPAPKGSVILFVASFFFGSSAILIRFATEASAISLTFFRLLIAAVAMILFGFASHSLRSLGKRDLLLAVVSGAVLSLHFVTFIFAVKETTIANATFLVNTSPIMLAVISPLLIKEKTTYREWIAVAVATMGILLVANAGHGFRAFGLGDLSAILAAFFVAIYTIVGRYLRTSQISTACYTSYVYSAATVTSLAMVAFSPAQTLKPYDFQNLLAIIGLGIFPTTLGHTLYNHALGSVKTVTANLFPLMEPIIASLLAVVLFAEIPTITQAAGYSLILVGVVIVAGSMTQDSRKSRRV
jgi:drug/metabolite transporter (DMT)-like permease